MLRSIEVRAEFIYSVHVGVSWRESFLEVVAAHKQILILAPQRIVEILQLEKISGDENIRLHIIPDGESAKDLKVAETLWNLLGEESFGRQDAIVAIGGGSTTDVAGFVAATWLRGIDWYAFPTSLAGMVDASIGGKTGINSPAGKNLIGAFHSPRAVYIDESFLETLSDRDFSAGLAEVIKCGFIMDSEILDLLEHNPSIVGARSVIHELIVRAVQVKSDVVSQDFKESSLREILNYGHTFGHALEKASGYAMRHGEAVSIGLIFAARLSQRLLGLESSVVERTEKILTSFALPTTFSVEENESYSWDSLRSFMSSDKKVRAGELRFVGLKAVSNTDRMAAPDEEILRSIYESICR